MKTRIKAKALNEGFPSFPIAKIVLVELNSKRRMVSPSLKEESSDVAQTGPNNLINDPTIRRNLDIMDALHKHIGKTEKIGLLESLLMNDKAVGNTHRYNDRAI